MIQLKNAADEPVGFPRPALHSAERNVKAAGGKSAEPVKTTPNRGLASTRIDPFVTRTLRGPLRADWWHEA